MSETNKVEEAIKAAKEQEEEARKNGTLPEEEVEETAEAQETEDLAEEEPDGEVPEGREGFFKNKKKKDKKDELIEELKDKVTRQMAEFENFRKRTDKEKSQMFEIGAKDIIEKILPVLDNFERGLATATEEEKATPFVEGMDKIYKQLVTTLEDAGVKEIDCLGKEFDPELHNAVMHEENEEAGENIITEVFQKGYTYKDTVVRHSMVKVAN
ncbi:MAG: nucleotide exchange factor GrpE [Lachnospiraceae bacterium]|jgi:molecular chaperone GrpE|nr:nucleotide exchange factor GrpE [Lachnospiraceae bacterium]